MTNFDAWQLYMRDVPTAQLYLDWGFYFLIGSALQRRVWVSGQENAIHPNMYVCFVGPPGTGKSLVMSPIKVLLMEQKYIKEVKLSGAVNGATARMVEILRFPIAADSTTFQSLVEETAEAVSVHDFEEGTTYVHHSISFILDELASIFKAHAEELTTFLLTVHGGHPYRRRIRDTSGRFTIEKPCVGILAGTVVNKLRSLIGGGILDTGMSSRIIFVYAQKSRFREALIPNRDDQQNMARLQLSNYLKKLHHCYGPVNYTEDALSMVRFWWKNLHEVRTNKDPALDTYYDRKALHLHKICLILLFSEQTESYIVTAEIVKQGIEILNKAEQFMHIPLSGGRRNVLYTIGVDILDFIAQRGSATELEILGEFLSEATDKEISEILTTLQKQKEIDVEAKDGQFVYTTSH